MQLASGAQDCAPLRDLQAVARRLDSVENDRHVRTAAFLLQLWIEDYYFNFAGDIPSDGSEYVDEVRCRMLSGPTANALKKLGEAVAEESVRTLEAYEDLFASYLEAIDEANRKVTG